MENFFIRFRSMPLPTKYGEYYGMMLPIHNGHLSLLKALFIKEPSKREVL